MPKNDFPRNFFIRRACYALVAAFIGGTRLIDNMLIEPREGAEGDFHVSL